MNRYQSKSKKGQNVSLSDNQKLFIIENWKNNTDAGMAIILKSREAIVHYYRLCVCGFVKDCKGRAIKEKMPQPTESDLRNEILALIYLGNKYPSFESGFNYRVKFLNNRIEND